MLYVKRILLLLILLGGALALPSSCTTIREFLGFGYIKPEIRLRDLEVKNITFNSIDLNVRLMVKNPNSYDIILKRMEYDVTVAGLLIAKGTHEKTITIIKERDNDVRLPLSVDKQNLLAVFSKLLENPQQELLAVMKANVIFDSPVGEIEQNFLDEKVLNRPGKAPSKTK